jgi:MarR family transcriptional regulator, organic hydroperoxide resistance regulator
MDNSIIESISDNIFHTFPLIYKKLLKVDFESVQKGMAYQHFLIMRVLSVNGALPISEIGRRLVIPRPQMTHMVDQLIELDIVLRRHCEEDRRVIYIELTDQGKLVLRQCGKLLRANIKTKLSYLDESELSELSALLVKLDEITAKLK